jgi:putative ABC transport system permease protein
MPPFAPPADLLTPTSLAAAAALAVLSLLVAAWLARLGPALIALARLVVQIAVAALLLKVVLATGSTAATTAGLAIAMIMAAALATAEPWRRHLGSERAVTAITAAIAPAALFATTFGAIAIAAGGPISAQHVLPALGLALAAASTAADHALSGLLAIVVRERAAIDAHLALGARRREVFEHPARRALASTLGPLTATLAATGAVGLPALFAGLVWIGLDPLHAAQFAVVAALIGSAAATSAALAATLAGVLLVTDRRGRLRLDRIRAPALRALGSAAEFRHGARTLAEAPE